MSKRGKALALVGIPALCALAGGAMYPSSRTAVAFVTTVTFSAGLVIFLVARAALAVRGHRPLALLVAAPSDRTTRPEDLASLERILSWKVYSAPEFDHRVRPVLRSILRARLLEVRGIDIDSAGPTPVSLPPALVPLVDKVPATGAGAIRTDDLADMVDGVERL